MFREIGLNALVRAQLIVAFANLGDPPAGNRGHQHEVVTVLVAAGASVEPECLEREEVRADPHMLAAPGRR